ncbi:hypothetical protein DRO61_01575 [Candidatus Bathyarchaeota archaeon]|jgi:hypothetical protein|nr:MAG: hypothetical protein DRO61_01575 [Candidatus Bathyarchaeota archaeon]
MKKYLRKMTKKRENNKNSEEKEIKKMAERILVEARKMAKLQGRHAAEEVLLEATALARWMKRPFYIA